MASCGIRLRYPVIAVIRDGAGATLEEMAIGEAETLAEARVLVERSGFRELEADEGGCRRFEPATKTGKSRFVVTVARD